MLLWEDAVGLGVRMRSHGAGSCDAEVAVPRESWLGPNTLCCDQTPCALGHSDPPWEAAMGTEMCKVLQRPASTPSCILIWCCSNRQGLMQDWLLALPNLVGQLAAAPAAGLALPPQKASHNICIVRPSAQVPALCEVAMRS